MPNAPFSILIAALGGEGGSVLMNWIVSAARDAGYVVQATSVPGVAQRTGSTSYYIEMMPQPPAHGPQPIFSLVPLAGRVDVVLASELVEAGRMMERAYVAPNRTTLIMSTSRVTTTAEKVHGGDGRFPDDPILEAAKSMAKRVIALDLETLARTHGTLVSATLYGALAGSGVLPFNETVAGKVVSEPRSRAGYEAAVRLMTAPDHVAPIVGDASLAAARVHSTHADQLSSVIVQGRALLTDYQDVAYADLYQLRIKRLVDAHQGDNPLATDAINEAARRLALWMAYEDIPRVADLKSRPERIAHIRNESEAKPDQIITVVDYLKPGLDEIAAMLPARLGARVMARVAKGARLRFSDRGIHLKATNVGGHLVLRLLASFKRSRRGSLRFKEEQAAIEVWLAAMEQAAGRNAAFAAAVAELPRLLKGYAETHARGRANYRMLLEGLVLPALADGSEAATVAPLRKAIATALAEPERPTTSPAKLPSADRLALRPTTRV